MVFNNAFEHKPKHCFSRLSNLWFFSRSYSNRFFGSLPLDIVQRTGLGVAGGGVCVIASEPRLTRERRIRLRPRLRRIIRFNLLFCKTQPEFANCPAFFLLQINRRRSSMGEQHLNAFNCSLKTANDRHGRTGCWLRVRIPSTAFAGQLVVFLSEFF